MFRTKVSQKKRMLAQDLTLNLPSFMDEEEITILKQELSASNTGWDTKQVMDLIQNKTGIKYDKDHTRRLLYQWGFSLKASEKKVVKRASDKEIQDFKKG